MREAPAAGRRAPRDGERRREAGGSDGGGGVHLLGAADLHQASAGRRHGRARPRRVPPHVRYRLPLPARLLHRAVCTLQSRVQSPETNLDN